MDSQRCPPRPTQKAEIKACVCHWLGELMDDTMSAAGFTRPENSLVYRREMEESVQEIVIDINHNPSVHSNAAAAMCPYYKVVMDAVNKTVEAMTDGDPGLAGNFEITMQWEASVTAKKKASSYYHIYQPDSVPPAVSEMRDFLVTWTIPFLDRFKTPADLCKAEIDGDGSDVYSLSGYLAVVAANLLCGHHDEALKVLDRKFGRRTGTRKKYQRVYDYLISKRGESQSG